MENSREGGGTKVQQTGMRAEPTDEFGVLGDNSPSEYAAAGPSGVMDRPCLSPARPGRLDGSVTCGFLLI